MTLKFQADEFNKLTDNQRLIEFELLSKQIPMNILESFFIRGHHFDTSPITVLPDEKIITLRSDVSQEILEMAYSLFNTDHFYDSEELKIVKQLIASMAYVHEALKPLSEILDMEYEIGLVGGAIRDLVLGKKESIKDLDIVFGIKNIKGFAHKSLKEENSKWMVKNWSISEKELALLEPEEFEKLSARTPSVFNMNALWSKMDFITKKLGIVSFVYKETDGVSQIEQWFFFIIKQLLEKQFTIDKAYPPKALPEELISKEAKAEFWRSGYHNALLRGVVKISAPKIHYPVDILICNNSVESYLSTFDLEICKSWITYTQSEMHELEEFLNFVTTDKIEKGYQKIGTSIGFIQDAKNKTLTLCPDGFDMNAIEEALLKHYPRVKEKFNDYTFNANQENWSKVLNEDVKNYIIKFVDYEKLNNGLPTKEESRAIKKKIRSKI